MKIEIKSTTDYQQWQDSKYQPAKRINATNDLIQSIQRTNGNMFVPALVHLDTNSVVDGHRRLQACKIAKVPFYYIEITDNIIGGRDAIKMMNTTSRQWSMMDFISSYATDNKEYAELRDLIEQRDIPVALITSFTGHQATHLKAEVSLNLNLEDLHKKIDVFKVVCGIYNNVSTNDIHRALGKLYKLEEFQPDRLISKLEILLTSNAIGAKIQKSNFFLRELCDAYDFKQKTKEHLFHKLIERSIIKN